MGYIVEVTTAHVAYRLEECPFLADGTAEEDHQCESDCTWMDGDKREIRTPDTSEQEPDEYDMEEYENNVVEWAVALIRKHYSDVENAPQMRDGEARESDWIDGSAEDVYRGDLDVTETTIFLKGEWTDAERGEVFRRATNRTGE